MNDSKSYRAALVIPIDGPPIENGVVTVWDGLIDYVGTFADRIAKGQLFDLGDAAIIPALVNTHTHLEFSHLANPLGHPGIEFTQWIRAIMKTRLESSLSLSDKMASIKLGLQESVNAGVGYVGEIATTPVDRSQYLGEVVDALVQPKIAVTVFHEQLGRNSELFVEKQNTIERFLSSSVVHNTIIQPAISPHAPYSVHPKLLNSLCELAIATKAPIAMHVAETMAERELLEFQTGPFVGLLQELGVWDAATFLPPLKILDVLKSLARTSRSLVIHGNYLNAKEIEFIASRRERMSVVYCPRTHAYFGHSEYPIDDFLKARICVAVGTDSRASNPDLDLFADLKWIAHQFPHLSPLEIMKLGTLNGATALGVDRQFGSITAGKRAALSVVRSPAEPKTAGTDFDWLFDKEATCQRVT